MPSRSKSSASPSPSDSRRGFSPSSRRGCRDPEATRARRRSSKRKRERRETLPFPFIGSGRLHTGNHTVGHRANLCRLRLGRGGVPRRRRAGGGVCNDRHVLRRREPLERRSHRRGSTEIRSTVIGGVLLFVGREIAKVGLHLRDI